jgi:chromate transporter
LSAPAPKRERLLKLVLYFLRLGCLGFGGPVALVGQMERELVTNCSLPPARTVWR